MVRIIRNIQQRRKVFHTSIIWSRPESSLTPRSIPTCWRYNRIGMVHTEKEVYSLAPRAKSFTTHNPITRFNTPPLCIIPRLLRGSVRLCSRGGPFLPPYQCCHGRNPHSLCNLAACFILSKHPTINRLWSVRAGTSPNKGPYYNQNLQPD